MRYIVGAIVGAALVVVGYCIGRDATIERMRDIPGVWSRQDGDGHISFGLRPSESNRLYECENGQVRGTIDLNQVCNNGQWFTTFERGIAHPPFGPMCIFSDDLTKWQPCAHAKK